MSRIAADAERASGIISSVRSAATKPPATESIDLRELLATVLDFLDRELRRARVRVSIEYHGDAEVLGDRTQLQQMFANLFINAIQSIDARGGEDRRIAITSRGAPSHIAIDIVDTGSGFPPESGPALFGTFFTTRSEGMGLGLAIARSVAERHGGSISACSDGSTGARFSVILDRSCN